MLIHKARDVILESLLLTKFNCSINTDDQDADSRKMFLAYQNIYIDSPKFICRMHRMRVGKDLENLKELVRLDNKDPEEKFIKRNLNEMCMLPRKKVFIAYDKDRDRTLGEILLEVLENYGLL